MFPPPEKASMWQALCCFDAVRRRERRRMIWDKGRERRLEKDGKVKSEKEARCSYDNVLAPGESCAQKEIRVGQPISTIQ
jgi:hypothetical protein